MGGSNSTVQHGLSSIGDRRLGISPPDRHQQRIQRRLAGEVVFIDPPMTLHEYTSTTTAKYSQLCHVHRQVLSVTQAWSARRTVQPRSSVFAARIKGLAAR